MHHSTEHSQPQVRFGVDRLVADPACRASWRRVGLVTNDAARSASNAAQRSRQALVGAGVPLVRLFGPEHGLGGTADDGASVNDGVDPLTGLPVISLYGARMRPASEQLRDLDALLFDIPDVGARFYTYAWTLWHALHACAEAHVPLIVLDRPNPLGGVPASAEGPLLEPTCRSFIGEDDIPVRHALTLGELARLWQREHCPGAIVEVVACDGWDAALAWPATRLPWIATSPAMPTFDSVMWYPGTCLFEATNLSVARGTTAPFTMLGAPWLRADAMARVFREHGQMHADVRVDRCRFTPAVGPHAGIACEALRLTLAGDKAPAETVAQRLRPVALGMLLLRLVVDLHPREFAWARYPTAANPAGADHLARLVGRREVEGWLESTPLHALTSAITTWTRADGWADRIAPIRLYG